MDNKRLISTTLFMVFLALGWFALIKYLDQTHPEWDMLGRRAAEAREAAATQPVATQPVAGGAGPATLPGVEASTTVAVVPVPTAPVGLRAVAAEEPRGATIGSALADDPAFAAGIDLSPRGAGIDAVTLNQFKKQVNRPDLFVFQRPYADVADRTRPLATLWAAVDGEHLDLTGVPWALERLDAASATYAIDLARGDRLVVRLTKTFALAPRSTEQSQGYLLDVDYAISNLTDRAVNVATALAGPTAPPKEMERTPDQTTLGGYVSDGAVVVEPHFIDSYTASDAFRDLTRNGKGYPLAWFGAGSAYFDAIVLPEPVSGGAGPTDCVQKVAAEAQDKHPDAKDKKVATWLETKTLTVAPGQAVTLPVRTYFIPKKRDVVATDYYQAFPRSFHLTLVHKAGPCAICAWDWTIDFLVYLLRKFHWLLRDWGLAIILLVVVVRVCLHPLTKAGQVRMLRMQKMAPEIERLKKKYGDDKDALNKAMAKYQMEQAPAMLMGCLPMVLQMPLWIALYSALQSTFELRQSPFLKFGGLHLTWIDDLAHPDRLFYFPTDALQFWLPLIGDVKFDSINILPLVLAVVFFLQQKLQPKPVVTDPQQAQQQKMMLWMSVILFPLILYNGPAGLNLYILTSTTIGIIESKRVRDHVKAQEAREQAALVLTDGHPAPTGGPPKPPGKVGAWIERIQKMAEDAQKQQQKPGPKRKR